MGRSLFITSETGGRAGRALSDILRDICKKTDADSFDVSRYSADIGSVCIVVCCFPDDLRAAGFGKARKLIKYQEGRADIRLPMPYLEFMEADGKIRYLMAVKNITEAVAVIGERCKKSGRAKFDSEGMTDELLYKIGIQRDELDGIVGVIP